jgi:predicted phosphodiesterase
VGLILCVNDIHARRTPPSSCTSTYWPDLLGLLDQTADLARAREVRAVVLAGDVFDHKVPGRTDHALVRELKERFIWPCRRFGIPVFAVAGNHDMQHDRPESVIATQPLGELEGPGSLRLLEGWAGDNLPLYGVPWQQDWSEERIRAVTADFRENVFSQTLVVTHAPIYPPGREPRYEGAEVTPAKWWADALEDGSLGHGLLYGHIHEPHGTYQAGTALTFCNYGALSRGSLDEYNRHRDVGVALWDTVSGEFEFVPLKAKPAEEVFRLQERDERTARQHGLDGFLSGVGAVTLSVLNVETVLAHIDTLGLDRSTRDLTKELLTAQQGGAR